jgi:hypothetical protein
LLQLPRSACFDSLLYSQHNTLLRTLWPFRRCHRDSTSFPPLICPWHLHALWWVVVKLISRWPTPTQRSRYRPVVFSNLLAHSLPWWQPNLNRWRRQRVN